MLNFLAKGEKANSLHLAFDISKLKLSLSFKKAYINVEFYFGDAARNLPNYGGILDITIGIAMIQWLRPR
ncbi:hypothetical protein PsorP6_008093 [Peronosclerospora sorghi]|uniref:Uncharacterized protein n=1 Tax=Peronosclerospora sorghi TaxID=230839 RepID=A0ACC0W7N1_9STRA|nr:hypothetical protein PsorP6_008093 [Peronosclerospora sorghi]